MYLIRIKIYYKGVQLSTLSNDHALVTTCVLFQFGGYLRTCVYASDALFSLYGHT
jgi:hypothetical protein